MTVEVRPVRDDADRLAAYAVRHEVFTVGQGVPRHIERDGLDDRAEHMVAARNGAVVGTGRLVPRDDGVAVVGRMAVLERERGTGAGAAVLRALEVAARRRALLAVELHAQTSARGFYDRAGYVAVGAEYEEAGIRHVTMRKPLPGVRDARDRDGPALVELIAGCWADYPGCVLDVDGEEPWLRAPASAYADWQGRLWVAETDGRVVACVGLRPEGPLTVSLHSLYVARPARSAGLGTDLVAEVEAEGRRRGASRVELWSDSRFLDAHRLYSRLGYERLPGSRELHDRSRTVEYPYARTID